MNWLGRFFRRRKLERQLDAELRFHVEQRTADLVAQGVEPAEARRRALIEFGGVERAKEECREARGWNFVEETWRDICYGVRMLRKAPAFATIAILTLGLGIGATTALFSVVNGVLLNPLPYKQPDRLVAIYVVRNKKVWNDAVSYPNFLDWRRDNRAFSSMAGFLADDLELTGMGEPERVKAERVSASFFPLLGVKPVVGRQFTAREDRLGGEPVALISGGFWKRKFGGARNIVGKTLTLNDAVYTIIGVIPADFHYESGNFHSSCDVFVPLGQWDAPMFRDRRVSMGMDAVGRLKRGVTLAQAKADMDLVARQLAEKYPNADKGNGIALKPLKQAVVGNVGETLLLLLGAVGLVLLIVCTNVASLLLARSTGRTREFAVRVALGASRGRVIRQLLTESVLLAFTGGALGVLFAAWGTTAALQTLPEALPRASAVHLDGRVLLFSLSISLFAGILFGLAPVLRTRRVDVQETLKEGGRGGSGARHRTQRIFVASEMALAVVLLIGAGLMIRSLVNLWNVNPGFDPHHVLTFGFSSPRPLGATPGDIRAAFRQIRERIAAVPGVEAAAIESGTMPMGENTFLSFWRADKPRPTSVRDMDKALFYAVQPDYLRVLKIPLLRGRFFTSRDSEHSRPVIVVDEWFAQLYFGAQNPIGRRINTGGLGTSAEIVGVVGHVKQRGLDSGLRSSLQAQMYVPLVQVPDRFIPRHSATVMVRTEGSPLAEVPAIRRAVSRLPGELVVYEVGTMQDVIADSLTARRFVRDLLAVFAGIALLLACVGIYGVIAYVTGQRAHEIGIRVALGARRSDVRRLVLGLGLKLALAGVAVGVLASFGLTRFLYGQLFGVKATDPLTFAAVPGVLLLVALAACYVPARRAARVDPMVSLRHE